MHIKIPKTDYRKSFIDPIPAWGIDQSGDVFIRCKCGKCISLDHDIDKNGIVSPSVWHDSSECNWHVWVKLLDWR